MADEQQVILPEKVARHRKPSSAALSWEASEYVQHHKPANWYVGFFAIGIAVSALLYLILQDIFAVGVVALMFVALFVYAVRKPQTLSYAVGPDGLNIGDKHYGYESFRSFSVLETTGVPSIGFEPLQRFSPPISIYCEPAHLDRIVSELAKYLPQADKQPDVIDRLAHYLRF
jgi:hypothetical protein